MPEPAALQRGYVGRHLANRNEMGVSGSDSYALVFLLSSVVDFVISVLLLANVLFG